MPWELLWMLLWPSLVSIALALVAWAVLSRSASPVLTGRALTAVLLGVAVAIVAVFPYLGIAPLWFDLPRGFWSAVTDARYALPLVIGLLVLIPLGLPRPRPTTPSGAALTPRTWRSFLATWWLGAHLVVLVLVLALTLAAGLASRPNDDGEYVEYLVDLGSGAIGTTIYGWHFSVLPLVLLALLTAAAWWVLARIARPPLAEDHGADAADRRLRSANVLRVALGALLLHLETVLSSLANTSRLSGRFSDGGDLSFSAGTPFSALTGTLDVLALLAGLLGLALWVFTALTALPAPSRARRTAVPA